MAYYATQTGVSYDELIGGTAVATLIANVTISEADAAVSKGAILDSSCAIVHAASGSDDDAVEATVAAYILAADIAVGDTVATVFTRGQFNRGALSVAEGDTVAAHEEELRKVGIYLTSLK